MSVPGRCDSCGRKVLQTWHLDTLDGAPFEACQRCIRELLDWPPLLTVEDMLKRIRGPLGNP